MEKNSARSRPGTEFQREGERTNGCRPARFDRERPRAGLQRSRRPLGHRNGNGSLPIAEDRSPRAVPASRPAPSAGNMKTLNSVYTQKPWLAQYRVPHVLAIPSATVIDALEENARRSPRSAAIHYFDETISFA